MNIRLVHRSGISSATWLVSYMTPTFIEFPHPLLHISRRAAWSTTIETLSHTSVFFTFARISNRLSVWLSSFSRVQLHVC